MASGNALPRRRLSFSYPPVEAIREGVARLMEVLQSRLSITAGAEVTLEANPEDVTLEAVRTWRAAGVNRVSLGAQSFDDAVLRWMHRTHDALSIRAAVERVRAAGIDDLSLDLIFALPNEIERSWSDDVAAALALEPTHISLYGLTTEPATPLGRWRDRGLVTDAPDEIFSPGRRLLVGNVRGQLKGDPVEIVSTRPFKAG